MTKVKIQILGNTNESNLKIASIFRFLELDASITEQSRGDFTASAVICDDLAAFRGIQRQYPLETGQRPVIIFTTKQGPTAWNEALPLSCSYGQLSRKLKVLGITSEAKQARRRMQALESLEGSSPAIFQIKELIHKVATTDASVLILGESGTGKELVARAIHRLSDRSNKPFVPVNCGAIPKDLLESELFGHEKGAFTGAITTRIGRFELAQGGTLFLDEIGDMGFEMQVKLLRVLQEKTFERVGSNKARVSDVRIIAATHNNLERNITEGTFREDLFYRLNVFPIEMPPLRERKTDIPALAKSMIERMAAEKGGYTLHQNATRALIEYNWPGNVRELANLIERLRILYPNRVVQLEDLPGNYTRHFTPNYAIEETPETPIPIENISSVDLQSGGQFDLKNHLNQIELELIKRALNHADGVVARAAKLLNLRRTTLVEKMRKHQLEREEVFS